MCTMHEPLIELGFEYSTPLNGKGRVDGLGTGGALAGPAASSFASEVPNCCRVRRSTSGG